MRVQLAGVAKQYGAQVVLDQVTFTIGPRARIGLVGPNGVGKSTLLEILAGVEQPDGGTVSRAPERLTVGYLEQERGAVPGESVIETLSRRTGIAQAEHELEESASALAQGAEANDRYSSALERFLSLGGGDFQMRARSVCAELGLGARPRTRAHGPLRGRSRASRACGDTPLAIRPAPARRAHERPRLRRARAPRAVSRRVSRRARRRLARPRLPRSDGRPDRRHRARLAPPARVDGRLDRLRGGARDMERAAALAEFEQAQRRRRRLDRAPEHATIGSSLERRLAREQDRRRRPAGDARARDQGAPGGAAPRAERAAARSRSSRGS